MSIAGDKWVRDAQTEFVLHEDIGSATGDNFTITDSKTENVVIKATAKLVSALDDICISDAETGEELCTIKGTILYSSPTYMIHRGGETIATVRKDRVSVRGTIRVYAGEASFNPLTNDTEAETLLQLHGGMVSDRNTEVYRGDSDDKIAHARERRFNKGGVFLKDEYDVTVEPGADIVLILASMIVKDEILEEKRERRAAVAAAVGIGGVAAAVGVAGMMKGDGEEEA